MRQVLSRFVLLFAIAGWADHAQAQFRTEIHPIKTRSVTATQFLNGKVEGPDAIVGGELRVPRFGEDRFPAVVLVHGSGGIASNVTDWAIELNKIGLVVFILDSLRAAA